MNNNRVKYYNKKIEEGNSVRILFAVNNKNYDNDTTFSADVLTYNCELNNE